MVQWLFDYRLYNYEICQNFTENIKYNISVTSLELNQQ